MILFLGSLVFAGAWTRDAGSYYAKASANIYKATTFDGPDVAEGSRFFGQNHGVYAELGVSRGHPVQLSLNAPLVIGAANGITEGPLGEFEVHTWTLRPGDLNLAIQTALPGDRPLAVAIEGKIPMYANGQIGNNNPIYRRLFPRPGDGQIDVTALALAGVSSGAWFGDFSVGYRYRSEVFVGWDVPFRFGDGVVGAATGGVRIGRVLWMARADGLVAFASDDLTRQWATLSGQALVELREGLGLELRLARDVWARNASIGTGAGIGVSLFR